MYLSPQIIITTGKSIEKRKTKAQVHMAIDILSYIGFEREWGKTKLPAISPWSSFILASILVRRALSISTYI